MSIATVVIKGKSPLLMNRLPQKFSGTANTTPIPQKWRDIKIYRREQEAWAKTYVDTENGFFIPSIAIVGCLRTAASIRGFEEINPNTISDVDDPTFGLVIKPSRIYIGRQDWDDIFEIMGRIPWERTSANDKIHNAQTTSVIRPRFTHWTGSFTISWLSYPVQLIQDLVNLAGDHAGLLDWRPSLIRVEPSNIIYGRAALHRKRTGGPYGRFEVTTFDVA